MSDRMRFNRLPDHVPEMSSTFRGLMPLRFDGAPDGPLAGDGKWRGVPDLEHSTLCRALGLDPIRFYFDLPSSMRGVGSSSSGHGGGQRAGRRLQSGFVFMAGRSDPVGKISVCFDGEKFADRDPGSRRDFEDLGRS